MKPIWMVVSAALFSAVPLLAQPVIGAKSGIVNYIEGKVFLADKVLELQPAQFPEVKENTGMRTEEGRAEILLTPGVVLRIGENSSFKMITNRLIDTRLELLSGSAVVDASPSTTSRLRIRAMPGEKRRVQDRARLQARAVRGGRAFDDRARRGGVLVLLEV